jgi:hypothetical protein
MIDRDERKHGPPREFLRPAGIGRVVIAVGRAGKPVSDHRLVLEMKKAPVRGPLGIDRSGRSSRRGSVVAVSGNELDAPSAA